jgi:mRNA interferase MazF
MPSTTSFKQGDVVLVPFPFTDLSAIKQRPGLVISPERLNDTRPDLVVAAITSQIPLRQARMKCDWPMRNWPRAVCRSNPLLNSERYLQFIRD